MSGININGNNYINKYYSNTQKQSMIINKCDYLYDTIYFMLIDLYWNLKDFKIIKSLNTFILNLKPKTSDLLIPFTYYTNALHDKHYVNDLIDLFAIIDKNTSFNFKEYDDRNFYKEIKILQSNNNFIKFDKWWEIFEEAKCKLDEQYNKCCIWEEENIDRDCDQLAELAWEEKMAEFCC